MNSNSFNNETNINTNFIKCHHISEYEYVTILSLRFKLILETVVIDYFSGI